MENKTAIRRMGTLTMNTAELASGGGVGGGWPTEAGCGLSLASHGQSLFWGVRLLVGKKRTEVRFQSTYIVVGKNLIATILIKSC
jgi:hypothetical protein